ncbi:proline dehydrogenase family protein [Microbacterium aureliae]
MSREAAPPRPAITGAEAALGARAVDLAAEWMRAAAPPPASSAGVGDRRRDAAGLDFARGLVDHVLVTEGLSTAASVLHRMVPLVPESLPWYVRRGVQAGAAVAPIAPVPVVLVARRVLRGLLGQVVLDARPDALGPALESLRATGEDLDLDLRGGAVLGEHEAARRLDGIHELVRRADVDRVTVPMPAIAGPLAPWALDESAHRVAERLLPLCLSAASDGTALVLDPEGHRHLELTLAVLRRILDDPRLSQLDAGIALPTSLPDALPALEDLTAWAKDRVDAGGAPIIVRLAAGSDFGAERADAALQGWQHAQYDTALDAAANHLRCLREALDPERSDAVRVTAAGGDLFGIAYAWLLAGERGVQDRLEIELPFDADDARAGAVRDAVGRVRRHVPVAQPQDLDAAIAEAVRGLGDGAGGEGAPDADPESLARRARFLSALRRSAEPGLAAGPRRTSRRSAAPESTADAPSVDDDNLTRAVLGIARHAALDPDDTIPLAPAADEQLFGGQPYVETAVFAPRESVSRAQGAPGFVNTPPSDPTVPATRAWARGLLEKVDVTAEDEPVATGRVRDGAALAGLIARVRDAGARWGAAPAAERAEVLLQAAQLLESRRGTLIQVAAAETGTLLADADREVSDAVDAARYCASTARELDAVSGAVFVPASVTVVTPPPVRALASAAAGVLAALAAGSGVVVTPAPAARRCAAALAEALWRAGVPRDLLVLADLDEKLGRRLVSHPDVDRVVLTGTWQSAELFRSWRADLPLHASTGGTNAVVVAPSADLDLAASDLVRSAFGYAGQQPAAASLAILVGPVGRSRRFARQLVDAVRSLRVGLPDDPLADVGPLVEQPDEALRWALTTLGEGEQWLIRPRQIDTAARWQGRLWSPGIRTGVRPGSRAHLEEFPVPVLGIMHAPSLRHAIELQNATAYGLAAGLHTRDPQDLAVWLDEVQAGSLFVNRDLTGSVVQRQPVGGWKRSAVGPGAKSGGPNHLVGLGSWRATSGGATSATLHLRGLDSRITAVIEAAQPSLGYEAFDWLRRGALSDALAWNREFGQVRDVSHLGIERNLLRYRPAEAVAVRATGDATWQALLRVVVAAIRAGAPVSVSAPVGLPAPVRRVLDDNGIGVFVESDGQWIQRMQSAEVRPPRARLVGAAASVRALRTALAEGLGGDPGVAVYADEVTTAGRLELLPFLREQSITLTAHRFGVPDPWSEPVI